MYPSLHSHLPVTESQNASFSHLQSILHDGPYLPFLHTVIREKTENMMRYYVTIICVQMGIHMKQRNHELVYGSYTMALILIIYH